MNEVMKAILNHPYHDEKMKRKVRIARRSKNKRIQNKTFTTLFYTLMKERPVKVVAEIVCKNGEYYAVLKRLDEDASSQDKEVG